MLPGNAGGTGDFQQSFYSGVFTTMDGMAETWYRRGWELGLKEPT